MISVVVITLNEADRIPALLKSAAFADEVIVVDSGSTDGTQEVCSAGGARVVTHPWQGFAAQKQYAMQMAASEWILNLDADERISDSLAAELQETIPSAPPEVCGFSMPRLSRYLDTWIRHGGWYPDRKVRLVRRGCGQWKGSGLHEKLEVSGKILPLASPILHDVYRNISDQVMTINRSPISMPMNIRQPGPGLRLSAYCMPWENFLNVISGSWGHWMAPPAWSSP